MRENEHTHITDTPILTRPILMSRRRVTGLHEDVQQAQLGGDDEPCFGHHFDILFPVQITLFAYPSHFVISHFDV